MPAALLDQAQGVEVDLHIPQGADWPGLAFPILDAANQPVDLSECTAVGQVRKTPRVGSAVLYSWSTTPVGFDIGTIVLAGNLVSISVPGMHSTNWTFTQARYDVFLTNPNAPPGQRVLLVARGQVLVIPQVTRP